MRTASECCGVAARTVRDWLQRALTEKGFSAFAAAVSRARARGRVTLINCIVAAKDWRADAWLLTRLAPDEFSERSLRDEFPPDPQVTRIEVSVVNKAEGPRR